MRLIWAFLILFLAYLQVAESNWTETDNEDDKHGRSYAKKLMEPGFLRLIGKSKKSKDVNGATLSLQSTVEEFVIFIEDLYKKAGWGPIFPGSYKKWSGKLRSEEEHGLGVGWPLRALEAIWFALKKVITIIKSFWSFFIAPVFLIASLKYVSPMLTPKSKH